MFYLAEITVVLNGIEDLETLIYSFSFSFCMYLLNVYYFSVSSLGIWDATMTKRHSPFLYVAGILARSTENNSNCLSKDIMCLNIL